MRGSMRNRLGAAVINVGTKGIWFSHATKILRGMQSEFRRLAERSCARTLKGVLLSWSPAGCVTPTTSHLILRESSSPMTRTWNGIAALRGTDPRVSTTSRPALSWVGAAVGRNGPSIGSTVCRLRSNLGRGRRPEWSSTITSLFRNATAEPLFGCDWASGKIYAIQFARQGATFRGTSEVFLQGRPLTATDIAVGPDGALYFCTGGRGTDGGVYRVRWTRYASPPASALGEGIERAIRQPQLNSDWARARIAGVKRTTADQWEPELIAIAQDAEPARTRTSASP